jgi:hypothetical protein
MGITTKSYVSDGTCINSAARKDLRWPKDLGGPRVPRGRFKGPQTSNMTWPQGQLKNKGYRQNATPKSFNLKPCGGMALGRAGGMRAGAQWA